MAAAPQPAANSQVAYRRGGRRRADAAAVAQTKRIFVYRNGDAFNPGKRVVVADRVYRNWEALLASLTSLLDLTGAVRRLFDVGGKSVRHLDEICDGADYVAAPGGETFRKVAYPVAATHSRMAPAGGGNGREGRVGRSIARKGSAAAPRSPTRADAAVEAEQARKAPGEKSRDSSVSRMFGPTSKGMRMHLFINGDASFPGVRFVCNARVCRTFEQLLTEVSKALESQVPTRGRKLYDGQTGRRITRLEDLYNGQALVVPIGSEPFRKVPYVDADQRAAAAHPRREDDAPRILTIYPNGDAYHTGIKMTVTAFKFPDLEKLMASLDHHIALITGKIKRIYTLHGQRIDSVCQLEHRKSYVVVAGDDPFQRIRYNINAPEVRGFLGHVQPEGDESAKDHDAKPVRTTTTVRRAKLRTARRVLPSRASSGSEGVDSAGEGTEKKGRKAGRTGPALDTRKLLIGKGRPSAVLEEGEEASAGEDTAASSEFASEHSVPAPGRAIKGSEPVKQRAATLQTNEQRQLASRFQKTYNAIGKHLGEKKESDDKDQGQGDSATPDQSQTDEDRQHDIEEEETAAITGEEEPSSEEGSLKQFDRGELPGKKIGRKVPGLRSRVVEQEDTEELGGRNGRNAGPSKPEPLRRQTGRNDGDDRLDSNRSRRDAAADDADGEEDAQGGLEEEEEEEEAKLEPTETETETVFTPLQERDGSGRDISRDKQRSAAPPPPRRQQQQQQPTGQQAAARAAALTGAKLREEIKRSHADLVRVRAGGTRLAGTATTTTPAAATASPAGSSESLSVKPGAPAYIAVAAAADRASGGVSARPTTASAAAASDIVPRNAPSAVGAEETVPVDDGAPRDGAGPAEDWAIESERLVAAQATE